MNGVKFMGLIFKRRNEPGFLVYESSAKTAVGITGLALVSVMLLIALFGDAGILGGFLLLGGGAFLEFFPYYRDRWKALSSGKSCIQKKNGWNEEVWIEQ